MKLVNFFHGKGVDSERRSRWDRWGLTSGRRDKTVSQPEIPTAISRDNSSLRSRQYSKLASGKSNKNSFEEIVISLCQGDIMEI